MSTMKIGTQLRVVLHHWTGEYFNLNADACAARIDKGGARGTSHASCTVMRVTFVFRIGATGEYFQIILITTTFQVLCFKTDKIES